MTCSVPGCGKRHKARGLCNMHHKRMQRRGTVEAHERSRVPDLPRGLSVSDILSGGRTPYEDLAIAVLHVALLDHQQGIEDLTEWFRDEAPFFLGIVASDTEDISHWHRLLVREAGIEG